MSEPQKLSEGIRAKYFILDEVVEPVYPHELREMLKKIEALEAEKQMLWAKFRLDVGILLETNRVLTEERDTLKEQVAGLEELNRGLDYCAEQEEIKRKDAESRIAEAEKLPEKWLTADWSCLNDRIEVANWCADELKKALCGVGEDEK